MSKKTKGKTKANDHSGLNTSHRNCEISMLKLNVFSMFFVLQIRVNGILVLIGDGKFNLIHEIKSLVHSLVYYCFKSNQNGFLKQLKAKRLVGKNKSYMKCVFSFSYNKIIAVEAHMKHYILKIITDRSS